jgi:PhzF family phenazine biosynthesis protein
MNGDPREYDYVLLDVFTKTHFAGNPLAVLPNAGRLSDDEMQRIAAEFNLSETVFLFPPSTSHASAKARIFTPRRDCPLRAIQPSAPLQFLARGSNYRNRLLLKKASDR